MLKKEDLKKPIGTTINFMRGQSVNMDAVLYAASQKIAITAVVNVDKAIIKAMYEAYKYTDVSKVFILDMEQFEKFLKEMLPKWREEK